MADPGIEIRWGSYDNYNDGSFRIIDPECRAVLRPKLQRVVGTAIDGLIDYGVPLTEKKYLDVYRVRPFYLGGTTATATTSKTMQIYLRPHQLGGHFDAGLMAHAVLHEGLHTIRQETLPLDTIGELAATEGIAYVADHLFKRKVPYWQYRVPSFMKRIIELPQDDIAQRRENLASVIENDLYSSLESESVLKPRKHNSVSGLRDVDVIGIAAVYRQVEAGRKISELLHLPAAEVLGFEN